MIWLILLSLLLWQPIRVKADAIPENAYIQGLIGHKQTYSLSCEARSASDLAAFWNVKISEKKFLQNLRRSDNPEKGFVGSPYDPWGSVPPNSYGVHATPVAEGLRNLGLLAEARYGMSLNELRREIANGRPVIVWIIGQMWQGTPLNYKARDGQVVRVAHFEHTMIVIGYDARRFFVVDAYTGMNQSYTTKTFKSSWSVLGNMAVTVAGKKPPVDQPTLPDRPFHLHLAVLAQRYVATTVNTPETYRVQRGDYLIGIAKRFGVNWLELARRNNLSPPYILVPGQELKIK